MSDLSTHEAANSHGNEPVALGYSPVADIPHALRLTDTDPRAARRAERQVATMFLLSMLMVVLFAVAYIGIDKSTLIFIPVLGTVGASTVALSVTMGTAIFLIGTGAIQWAKKLMPDVEVVQDRHDLVSAKEDTEEAAANYQRGKVESGFGQYTIIRRTLLGALALFPIPLVIALRDLWVTPAGSPSPDEILSKTLWKAGERILIAGTEVPIKPQDFPVGSLISAVPATFVEDEEATGQPDLNQLTKAALILVRMDPAEIVAQQGDGWDYQGILAYSKICTHVGCPIALYEQRTHHLLCPCHQSTFDLADAGNVIFGPAARRMPQLPIGVDEEGFLIAKSDFQQPVGPSFWERA